MAKKKSAKSSERGVVKARGSQKKRGANDGSVLHRSQGWKVARIAYDPDGNIVILDPRVAELVRRGAEEDRRLEVGVPAADSPVEIVMDLPMPPRERIRPILSLCACGKLRFKLVGEQVARARPSTVS